ncbi:ankyrin repeat domain-containing protein [Rhodopirellula europaea]|uniref:ankyrin repeat domain-containing protein n=1 Tax=Rhodopirellula europaea TaxID=1263866 RepID=UPI003D278523
MSDSDPNDDLPPGSIVPSSPIEYWAAVGNLEQVQRAIDDGHDVNASDDAGYTALHAAAENNHIEIAKLLLRYGAYKTGTVTSGETPADLAALSGHDAMVNLLSD